MSFTSTLYSRKWKNGEESVQTVVWDNSGADLPWVTDLGFHSLWYTRRGPTWAWNLLVTAVNPWKIL